MPIIDLTYPITADMPVFPGSPAPEIRAIARLAESGFREKRLCLASHTGTHVDAPNHLLPRGKTLDQFPVNHFVGPGFCIDVSSVPDGIIEWAVLKVYEEKLRECELVILRTGWGHFWGTPRYFSGYPVLTPEAARALAACNIKAVGVDTLSVDRVDAVDLPVHRILMEDNVLIIENLARLDRLTEGRINQLCCLPLHLKDADGAPARVIAIL